MPKFTTKIIKSSFSCISNTVKLVANRIYAVRFIIKHDEKIIPSMPEVSGIFITENGDFFITENGDFFITES